MHLSIVIPAYNESEGVAQTAEALRPVLANLARKHTVEVIFVNDGSRDDTLQRLESAWANDSLVCIVSHENNRGLGAAIRTGFAHANGEVIITTDFDGTYAYDLIPALLEKLHSDSVDIVTASPYHPKGGKVEGVPAWRLAFSFGASLLYRLLVKGRIYTWTALFRAYRRPVIRNVPFESDGFLAGTELLVNALRVGYTVSEFPATLRIRTYGQSSMKVTRTVRAHLAFQWQIVRARLAGDKTGVVSSVSRKA